MRLVVEVVQTLILPVKYDPYYAKVKNWQGSNTGYRSFWCKDLCLHLKGNFHEQLFIALLRDSFIMLCRFLGTLINTAIIYSHLAILNSFLRKWNSGLIANFRDFFFDLTSGEETGWFIKKQNKCSNEHSSKLDGRLQTLRCMLCFKIFLSQHVCPDICLYVAIFVLGRCIRWKWCWLKIVAETSNNVLFLLSLLDLFSTFALVRCGDGTYRSMEVSFLQFNASSKNDDSTYIFDHFVEYILQYFNEWNAGYYIFFKNGRLCYIVCHARTQI